MPKKLQHIRRADIINGHFLSSVDSFHLRQSVEAAIAETPELNVSWVNGEGIERYRISSFDHIGDMLLTVDVTDLSNSVRIVHRRGDVPLLAKLIERLDGKLTNFGQPRVPRGLINGWFDEFIECPL